MLTVHQLAKSFALNSLFSEITFSLSRGDRKGLVGPNGCGKSTLLRIIAGEETADSGHVTHDAALRIGYLPQGFELDPGASVAEVVGRAAGDVAALEAELLSLAGALAQRPDDARLGSRYDAILERISRADTGRAAAILAGLGLDTLPPDLPVRRLSGGQKTRLNLALVLLGEPELLLLDEPTNHLDIAMLEWLESWLAAFDGGALIVSHDRTFLDRTVDRILALDAEQGKLAEYAGNYSEYQEQLKRQLAKQWAAYKDQQEETRRIKGDIMRAKTQAAHTERGTNSDYQRRLAKKVAKKAKAREGKLERYLEGEDRVERPDQRRRMRLEFDDVAHLGQSVFRLVDLCVGYDVERPLLVDLQLHVGPAARIVLTGPNGGGKTTLLRTIAGQIPSLSGRVERGPTVHLGYMTQEQADFDPASSPLDTIQAYFKNETDARNFLAKFLITGQEPLRANSRLSYGQRARLALAQMVAAGCNVLLLDEPINHLDIPAREQFEEALHSFEGPILAVMHDRYFIERFATEIWWLEDKRIRRDLC